MQTDPGRRGFLKGGLGMAALGFMGLSGCTGGDSVALAPAAAVVPPLARPASLSFSVVAKAVADAIAVPAGYTATVLYRFGDPLTGGEAAFSNLGTDSAGSMDFRAGDNHDGNTDALAADATGDFRNAANTYGWTIDIDPFSPTSEPRKRTALGRFAHERAWPGKPAVGRKLAFYQGDDARDEYIYKYVSDAVWDAADVTGGLAAGDKYLNAPPIPASPDGKAL